MLQKNIYIEKQQKISCFHAHEQVSQRFNNHIVFSYKKIKKYILAYILNFNNQFIKAMKTRILFQKY
jgi:hypothetical protein